MIVQKVTRSTPRLSASSKGMTQSKISSSAFFKRSKVYGQPVKSPERSSSLVESIYNPGFHHYLPPTIRPPAHHCQLHRLLGNEEGQRLLLALLVHLLAAGRSTSPTELTNGPINALANYSVLYTYNADRTTARWQLDVPTWVTTTYGMSTDSSTYARYSEWFPPMALSSRQHTRHHNSDVWNSSHNVLKERPDLRPQLGPNRNRWLIWFLMFDNLVFIPATSPPAEQVLRRVHTASSSSCTGQRGRGGLGRSQRQGSRSRR
jgi:hypothetical protein